jgi:hypothetical protein
LSRLFGTESGEKLTRNKGSDGYTEPTFEHDWIESSIGAINETPKPTAVIIQLSAEFLAGQQNAAQAT